MIFDPLFEEFKENKMNLIKKQLDISVGDNGGEFIPTFEPQTEIEFIKELNQQQGVKETNGKLEYELDWSFITDMAKRMAENKTKYGKYNWKKPIDKEQLKQALFRHVLAIMEGKTNENHFAAISCNAMMLQFQEKLRNENK